MLVWLAGRSVRFQRQQTTVTEMDTTRALATTSDGDAPLLPPGYDNVLHRLQVFAEHLSGQYGHILPWLLASREWLLPRGKDLPAPWIFANDRDVVELEWEIGPRFLSLRLEADERFAYTRVDDSVTPIDEQVGTVGPADVERLLRWVVG